MEATGEAAGAVGDGGPPAPAVDPFARMSAADVVVSAAWKGNCAAEFAAILDRLRRRPGRVYISIDLEFCGLADVDPNKWLENPEKWHDYITRFVHGGDVLQLGIALAFEQPAGAPPEPVVAWDINFRFDVENKDYHPVTIGFLRGEAGHDLAEHRDHGVLPEWVCSALLRHLPFGDPTVTWTAFHGDKDVAFVLKLLQRSGRGLLPPERADFIELVRDRFACFYDVKVLAQLVHPGYRGGLQDLATILHTTRIGQSHHASSDALLAMSCYASLVQRFKSVEGSILCRQGLLSGLEQINPVVRSSRFIGDTETELSVVNVNPSNFDAEARRIAELIPANFSIIFVVVSLPGLPPLTFSPRAQEEYRSLKCCLSGRARDVAELVLGLEC